MVQASFAERLQRIEMTQDQPISERMVAGVSEASLSRPSKSSKGKKPRKAGMAMKPSKPGGSLFVRLVAGFVLVFASFQAMSRMDLAKAWLEGSTEFAQHASMIMMGVAVLFVFVMLFSAFKMQRATFRILSEPRRIPFALGMGAGLYLGLSTGVGPAEFTDNVLAQLQWPFGKV